MSNRTMLVFLALHLIVLLQTASLVQSFATVPTTTTSCPSRRATAAAVETQLNMALALPNPMSRTSKLRRAWYEETSPLARRTVYNDDFFLSYDDDDDDDIDFQPRRPPFAGIVSTPFLLKSTTSTARASLSQRKRDKLRRVAKRAWNGLRRNKQ